MMSTNETVRLATDAQIRLAQVTRDIVNLDRVEFEIDLEMLRTLLDRIESAMQELPR